MSLDDSHSVGMKLLEIAFEEWGLGVKNLGILSNLNDFLCQAHDYEIVFISCMNGHADLYFDEFPKKPAAWYLGGNLFVKK